MGGGERKVVFGHDGQKMAKLENVRQTCSKAGELMFSEVSLIKVKPTSQTTAEETHQRGLWSTEEGTYIWRFGSKTDYVMTFDYGFHIYVFQSSYAAAVS